MSAEQLRYRTLVNNIGRVYASATVDRTALLQTGLGEIVDAIKPASTNQWGLVKADSERLLSVWSVKEGGDAATAVVTQLRDILQELSSVAPAPVSFPVRGPDSITHVPAFSFSFPVRASAPVAAPVPVVAPAPVAPVPVVAPVVSEIKTVTIAAPSLEVEEVEEEVVEEEEEEVEEEEAKVVEPEPEVEEEEEDGMEVEQITIRGRTYWIDAGSQKLYANAEGDEVGDEVGALVNGKPVFLAK